MTLVFFFSLRTLKNLRFSPILDRKFISVDLHQENTQDSIAGSVLVEHDDETGIEMDPLER